jgi:alcohol dehydrogenase class IV
LIFKSFAIYYLLVPLGIPCKIVAESGGLAQRENDVNPWVFRFSLPPLANAITNPPSRLCKIKGVTFTFATANQILFGVGTFERLGNLASGLGKRAFVIGGRNLGRLEPVLTQLRDGNIAFETFSVPGEPSIPLILEGLNLAKTSSCNFVVAMGGGSVLDAGKAISALMTNPGEPLNYLEVVGKGQPLKNRAAPFIAIPTTSGTGSEVTSNAVLSVPEKRVKVSMRGSLMLPSIALVDPTLTYSLPPDVTALTGLDALTQCLEPFVSNQANPMTDSFCREGLKRAARSLQRACEFPGDATAREDMSLASLFGGLALANSKLGAVHGFAGPLGGMIEAPHGRLCASLLPYVVKTNIAALHSSQPASPTLRRFDEIAQIITGNEKAKADDAVTWLSELCKSLNIPTLSQLGLTKEMIPEVVSKAQNASSMKGNPIVLTVEELTGVLEGAL